MLRKFLIERDVPGIGGKNPVDLAETAKTSNIALAKLRTSLYHGPIDDLNAKAARS